MTRVRVTRRHALLRREADGTESVTALAMSAESRAPGAWRLRALPTPPAPPSPSLVRAVARELCEKGAAALGGDGLLVEAGGVACEAVVDGVRSGTWHRPHLLVRDGDHVVHLRDGLRPPAALPWSRTAGPEDVHDDDPVVLGPAALLALLAAREEEAAAGEEEGTVPAPAARTSPYPPHDLTPPHLPGHTGEALAEAGELLSDPALWHVPHGTFTAALRPALPAVRMERGAAPRRALVLDSLVRHGRTADGLPTWRAAFSVRDGTGGTGRGTGPLIVRGDPADVLRHALHACGAERPALVRDPIARASYASAPPVMTSLRAGEVIASAARPHRPRREDSPCPDHPLPPTAGN
ncbi:hypothetical protein [Streptomyces sp. UNOC14_S4]|uniref:hypothetical protein n=1 Tax=Streptomyces sp. UNOC14_S4 TaxID=2872340 RepID=UPI001E5E88B2|nr:hypothetical protein [Streptomyces sp. UNOC14_S4]MCC3768930.1 hypothetical protein [Streptomyces sp. UNOC14_S4]